MGKTDKSIGEGISKIVDGWSWNKRIENRLKAEEIRDKKEAEILEGTRKIRCGFCGKIEKLVAKCSRSIVCNKQLCINCAKKCPRCKRYFCQKQIINHKCIY